MQVIHCCTSYACMALFKAKFSLADAMALPP